MVGLRLLPGVCPRRDIRRGDWLIRPVCPQPTGTTKYPDRQSDRKQGWDIQCNGSAYKRYEDSNAPGGEDRRDDDGERGSDENAQSTLLPLCFGFEIMNPLLLPAQLLYESQAALKLFSSLPYVIERRCRSARGAFRHPKKLDGRNAGC